VLRRGALPFGLDERRRFEAQALGRLPPSYRRRGLCIYVVRDPLDWGCVQSPMPAENGKTAALFLSASQVVDLQPEALVKSVALLSRQITVFAV
jgi:hypothetical protein